MCIEKHSACNQTISYLIIAMSSLEWTYCPVNDFFFRFIFICLLGFFCLFLKFFFCLSFWLSFLYFCLNCRLLILLFSLVVHSCSLQAINKYLIHSFIHEFILKNCLSFLLSFSHINAEVHLRAMLRSYTFGLHFPGCSAAYRHDCGKEQALV